MRFFFFNDTATTEIYTLSLHDALPISDQRHEHGHPLLHGASLQVERAELPAARDSTPALATQDRKSTRLNSSHANISYAVFCLKKKKHFLHPYHSILLLSIHLSTLTLH